MATVVRAPLIAAEVQARVRPRATDGVSALLLAYTDAGRPDLDAFSVLLAQTLKAGLWPAVNMDTRYVNLPSLDERLAVLDATAAIAAGRPFVGGAFVENVARSSRYRGSKASPSRCTEVGLVDAVWIPSRVRAACGEFHVRWPMFAWTELHPASMSS